MEQKVILLVEDDYLNRRLTKKTLVENNFAVLEAKNTKEAMEILRGNAVDLIVLDIHLGDEEQDGVSLGRVVSEKYAVPFIYLTAFHATDIVREALATTPYSYLIKPFKPIELITSIEIAIKQFGRKHVPKIQVKDGEYNVELPIDEIKYIESVGNYLLIYCDHKIYKMRSTMKQVIDLLPESLFVQVHRAYVVNKKKVEKFNSRGVIIGDIEIPTSKNYSDFIL